MADKPIEELVEEMGYCCPYGYFTANYSKGAERIAEELGVNARLVGYWRKKVSNGQAQCRLIPRRVRRSPGTVDCIYADYISH